MSDWELVVPSKQKKQIQSDWEMVQPEINSQRRQNNESLGTSALKAIPRIGEDLYRGVAGFVKNIPEYWNSAKTEVPGLFNSIAEHPGRSLSQLGAGITELGHNTLNAPRGIADYASNRLNLLPQKYAEKIPYQDDISSEVNQFFGEPKQAGEKLIRGLGRNALNIYGAGNVANILNPLNLTAKNIVKDVLKAEKKNVLEHSKRYDKIWNEADKTGFNQVPVNQHLLSDHLTTIEKYKTPREYKALEDFIIEPSLQNAQRAQSDMGIMHRKLEEKSRSGSLTSEEQALYKAAHEAEKHIESNMFKDEFGNINDGLQDKYKKLTKSYRQNVVPYKYNKAIQDYKAEEMLPKELVNSLSKGEFAVKKGSKHRAIGIRNNLGPISLVSALGIGMPWLYHQMFGDNQMNQ
jgi:hypothetical protein